MKYAIILRMNQSCLLANIIGFIYTPDVMFQ